MTWHGGMAGLFCILDEHRGGFGVSRQRQGMAGFGGIWEVDDEIRESSRLGLELELGTAESESEVAWSTIQVLKIGRREVASRLKAAAGAIDVEVG